MDQVWTSTSEGQTLLMPFSHAPFPHPSRAKGYTYNGKTFEVAAHYSDSTVGIVVPTGFRPELPVHYVVHFHGWTNHVAQVLDRYALRQQLAASGRNAVLLVPQGPVDATDSSGGKLEDTGGFERLIREVTAFLVAAGKLNTSKLGSIVLSAHSGGYRVTSAIVERGGLNEHLTDVLLFDASYGGLDALAAWGAGRDRRLLSLFTRHLAPENFQLLTLLQKRRRATTTLLEPDLTDALLQRRQPLLMHTLELEHDEVLQKRSYFARFLQTSALPTK